MVLVYVFLCVHECVGMFIDVYAVCLEATGQCRASSSNPLPCVLWLNMALADSVRHTGQLVPAILSVLPRAEIRSVSNHTQLFT